MTFEITPEWVARLADAAGLRLTPDETAELSGILAPARARFMAVTTETPDLPAPDLNFRVPQPPLRSE
jgi:hypothetical protein